MTLEFVRMPPEAVISWLTVTSVFAMPWYSAAVRFAVVPRPPRMALSTPDCCELKFGRYEPMENADSGVWAAIDDLSVVTVDPA